MTQTSKTTSGPRAYRGPGLPPRWVPVAVVVIGCAWAAHYVWHTNQNSYGDQDTVLFINFLIWPLLASAVAVVVGALRGPAGQEAEVGLSDYRRLILICAVPIYGIGVVYGGFVIASIAFVLILLPILGVRSPFILAIACLFVTTLVWFGFSYLMSVPLPLWPRGVTF